MDSVANQSELPETGSPPAARSFAEIHRDAWRVVRSAPAVFVLLPAILWFPFDVLIEAAALEHGGDWLSQLRFYNRLGNIAYAIVGTLVTSIFLAALIELGAGRPATLGRAVKAGFAMWGRILGVFFSAGWRIVLAFLLLIIPGIYLAMRYALAMPAAAFEGHSGSGALDASAEYMKGRYDRVSFAAVAAVLIYLPLAAAPTIVAPGGASLWLLALTSVPYNILFSCFTIGLTLLYADARRERSLAPPVGSHDPRWMPMSEPGLPSGRRGVFYAVAASATSVLAAFYLWGWLAAAPIEAGDEAWSRDAYEEALEHYRHAAYWDPEDAYVQYSIAWAHYELGRTAEAETHFARAVELEPENPQYRVDYARVLIDLGQTEKAGLELKSARQTGLVDPEVLTKLEVLAASRRARAQLPELRQAFQEGMAPGEYILLKAPFATPDGGTEWMWVEVVSWQEGKIQGHLTSQPQYIPDLQAGQSVEVEEDVVFDYIRRLPDGTEVGNETGRIPQPSE